ncbi:hypothetical protein FCM35_KLT21935 [Carex littledalei]|uniref:Uncharacterized protein n=1 Tax=Carex littledalei TaxID=544730 RepID=A0A833QBH4_9POAL|nr:hypothetical protein FCM35_KLT21935 [Carex littledalei]
MTDQKLVVLQRSLRWLSEQVHCKHSQVATSKVKAIFFISIFLGFVADEGLYCNVTHVGAMHLLKCQIRLNEGSRERRKELKSQEQLLGRLLSQRGHLYEQELVPGHHQQVPWWSRQQ